MRVSVIVPTYRRPESLARCLRALMAQETPPDEILVVVRREDSVSRQVAGEYGAAPIRLVAVDVPTGCPGFVAALNAGIAASSGAIVCLTDDDAEPHPDWISRIVAAFDGDAMIGAVGGRDYVYHDGQLEIGAAPVVGIISRWGRLIGNHHLGVGPRRDVAVLKGVNLSVRGDLIRQVGFDTRLRGRTTEQNSEPGLCLRLLRMGFRIVYDPAIAVDHRPESRIGEARKFDAQQQRDAAHNQTLALLEYLPLGGQAYHLLWTIALGTRREPGLIQSVRLLLTTGNPQLGLLFGNIKGRVQAVITYLRSRT